MTLTSVKVQSELFEDFKVACVRHKFSLQKLADRVNPYVSYQRRLQTSNT